MEGKSEPKEKQTDRWRKIIHRNSSYLCVGDVGSGKSGLCYGCLERFSVEYNLKPYTVGLPVSKRELLPAHFKHLNDPSQCTEIEDAIIFIDEADLQLPMDNMRMKEYVINFLSLPRHRRQILILAFHYPRLVMGTYLPFFRGFFFKRPPFLLEFATKEGSKVMLEMMRKAEERFLELESEYPPNDDTGEMHPEVIAHTYVVAPRLRWQGMLRNGLPSFWTQELSEIWSGTSVAEAKEKDKDKKATNQLAMKWTAEDDERLKKKIESLKEVHGGDYETIAEQLEREE